MAKVGIIYATKSGMIRRWIKAPNERALAAHPLSEGESMMVVDGAGIAGRPPAVAREAVRAHVAARIGREPPVHRCAVVGKDGRVKGIILADPEIDKIDGHDLVAAYDGVTAECTYDKATDTFHAPFRVMHAGVDDEGKPYPKRTIGGPVQKPERAA